jgi:hypothetical protein
MKHDETIPTPAVGSVQPVNHSVAQPRILKVALDVQLAWHVAAIQYDGSHPKPPQGFTPAGLLAWVQKQLAQGWRIISSFPDESKILADWLRLKLAEGCRARHSTLSWSASTPASFAAPSS